MHSRVENTVGKQLTGSCNLVAAVLHALRCGSRAPSFRLQLV